MPLVPSRWTRAAATGATVSVLVTTILTIISDLHRPFWNWLRDVFGHHWLGKGYIAAGIFLLVLFITSRRVDADGQRTNTMLSLLVWVTLVCAVGLAGFFWYEFIKE